MESILSSIKKLLGIEESYTHFDTDLIIHINSVLMVLTQLGVGPTEGFVITSSTETWNQFLTNATTIKLEATKAYVFLKVKLMFDPPTSSAVMEAYNRQISELEWRLNVAVEPAESM